MKRGDRTKKLYYLLRRALSSTAAAVVLLNFGNRNLNLRKNAMKENHVLYCTEYLS